jgi:hypothetical protein
MQYPAMLDQNIHLSPRQPYSLAIGQYLVSFIGRSFRISCEVKGRIGASQFLSRRFCVSGAGKEYQPGQSRFYFPQITRIKSADERRTGLSAVHSYSQAETYRLEIPVEKSREDERPGNDRWAALNFENKNTTLQLRGGRGVDAPRPLFESSAKKEM